MNGQFPSWPFLIKFPLALDVLAAPFVQVRQLYTSTVNPKDVMGEHEFIFRFALLKRLLQPPVLCVTKSAFPSDSGESIVITDPTPLHLTLPHSVRTLKANFGTHLCWRMPVGIDDNE